MSVVRQLLLILGGLAASVLVVASASSMQTVESGWLAWWPECTARRAGSSCTLCGMSHAFVAISHGRFAEAQQFNSHAGWVYALFLAQSLIGLWVGAKWWLRRD